MTRSGLIRIVVVDDDDDLRDIAQQMLAGDGRFHVAGVGATGIAAVDLVRSTTVDVVLLDLEMPWLHGAEAVPLIRSASPDTTVVIWTIDPNSPRADEAMQMGASCVLAKAYFSPRALPDQVCRILGHDARPRPRVLARSAAVSLSRWE